MNPVVQNSTGMMFVWALHYVAAASVPLSTNLNPICCFVAPKSPPTTITTTTTSKPTYWMHFAPACSGSRSRRGQQRAGQLLDGAAAALEVDLDGPESTLNSQQSSQEVAAAVLMVS